MMVVAWRGFRSNGRWSISFVVAVVAASSAALLFVAAALGIALSPRADLPAILRGHALASGRLVRALPPLEARFIAARLGSATSASGDVGGATSSRDHVGASAGSSVTERVVERHALTNDSVADALTIASVPFTGKTDTTAATRRAEDPGDCSPVGGTVWYRYRAERDVGLVAYTFSSDHATTLGVFEQTASGLRAIGCDTDARGNSLVSFAAKSGRTYLFQVAAPAGGGNLAFNLDPSGVIRRATIGAAGDPPDEFSGWSSISDDGRYVAFVSSARNLIEGNGPEDEPCPTRKTTPDPRPWPTACAAVWLRDFQTNTTELVSVADDGTPADSESSGPFVSADGRYVVFSSYATNLAPNDPFGPDLFVRDRVTRRTERIPAVDPAVSSESIRGFSLRGSISADGRYVAFQTPSPLVDDDDNGVFDVYVYDRWTERHEPVSVSSEGREASATDQSTSEPAGGGTTTSGGVDLNPYISRTGRFVVFRSNAPDLVPGDHNKTWDTFVRDRLAGTTERVSVSSDGSEGNGPSGYQIRALPTISDDGRFVVFYSAASNLVANDPNTLFDVFVRDRLAGTTARASEAWDPLAQDGHYVFGPSISANGRFVHLESANSATAVTYLTADTDSRVYRFDTTTSTLSLVSVAPDGSDSRGQNGAISGDGHHVVFDSSAANLAGETNGLANVFVHVTPGTR